MLFYLAALGSAWCKLSLLHSKELWLDETYSVFIVNLPFRTMFRIAAGDVHPPLYYALLWGWVRLLSDRVAELRLFTVCTNLVAMVGMFFLGRRVLGPCFGTLAAVLFALSPMLLVYSLEVRGYMLFTMFLIFLLLAHWKIAVENDRSKFVLGMYCVFAAAIFYVHYIGIFFLFGLFAHWTLCSPVTRAKLYRIASAGAVILLLAAPQIPVMLAQHTERVRLDERLRLSHSDSGALSFGVVDSGEDRVAEAREFATSAAVVAGAYSSSPKLLSVLSLAAIAALFVSVLFLWIVRKDEVCRLFGIVAVAVGIGVVVLHLYRTRYLLPLVCLLLLAFCRVLQSWTATKTGRRTALSVAAVLVASYAGGFRYQMDAPHGHPWQAIVDAVQQGYRPGDEVLFNVMYAQLPFDYYARQRGFSPREQGFPQTVFRWWDSQRFKGWGGPVISQTDLAAYVSSLEAERPRTLWLVESETDYYDPHELLLARLRQVGQVTQVPLPAEPERYAKSATPTLLFRIVLP